MGDTRKPMWTNDMIYEWSNAAKEEVLHKNRIRDMISSAHAEGLAETIRDEYEARLAETEAERNAAICTLALRNPDALAGDIQQWVVDAMQRLKTQEAELVTLRQQLAERDKAESEEDDERISPHINPLAPGGERITPASPAPEGVTQPDWSQAPEWAQWWAVDGGTGAAFWHERQPKQHNNEGWIDGGRSLLAYHPGRGWHKTLTQRPPASQPQG